MNPTRPSFIPQQTPVGKPPALRKRRSVSVFASVVFIILFITLATSGGTLVYQYLLNQQIKKTQEDLVANRNKFDQDLLDDLRRLDARMMESKKLLAAHVAPSRLFDLFEAITVQNVQFATLAYETTDSGRATLDLAGVARSFNALALQSDQLMLTEHLSDVRISEIMVGGTGEGSSPSPSDDYVQFAASANVNMNFISAEQNIQPIEAAEIMTTETATTGPEDIPQTTDIPPL